jgi:CBS domain-containing protein
MRTVANAMITVPIVDASTTIQDASAAMLDDHVEAAIVVDVPRLRGLVTAPDVAGGLSQRDVGSTLVAEIASWDPVIVGEQDALAEARERMRAADVALAVVVGDDDRPVGLLPDDERAV